MRIAWVTTGFSKDENDFGGAAAIHNLARELSLSGEIELTIFSLYYPANKPEYDFYKARVFSFAESEKISKPEKVKLWKRCRKKFAALYAENRFDIIYSIWSGESGYIASRLGEKFDIPFIANICGGELAEIREIKYGSRLKFWQKTFVNTAFERADKIVAASDYVIEKIRTYYDKPVQDIVTKIPFGVDEKKFYPPKKKQSERFPVLIAIGSAAAVKAYGTMLKAIHVVKKKYPPVQLIIFGKDHERRLRNLVNESNLNDNVEIRGFIDTKKSLMN